VYHPGIKIFLHSHYMKVALWHVLTLLKVCCATSPEFLVDSVHWTIVEVCPIYTKVVCS